MADTKTYPDKHVAISFVPLAGIASIFAPTAAELNAGVNISRAIAWDGLELNPEDSSDIDDAAITDSATAVEAGFDQYGVTLPLFYPKDLTLSTDPYVIAYNIFKPGRVAGYIVRRFKPAVTTTTTYSDVYAATDWVEIFKVIADFAEQDTEGEDSTKYTVHFLPQGTMSGPVLVKAAAPVVVSPGTASITVAGAGKTKLTATLSGFDITSDVTWTSSDNTKATVQNGVVKAVAAGTATITGTYASGTAAGTSVITVT
jgi:hypothetical protein